MSTRKVSEILRDNGFAFKKQLGQNFITDKNLLDDIVMRAGVDASTTVVEIGCGAGTLTRAIAERAKKVFAFEVDTKLKPVLAETLSGIDNAEVIFRDFLKVRMDEFERELGEPYIVVANLPYYITTPLIMQIIEHSSNCLSMSVMVQQEVAKRLCAMENTPDYGAITAVIALRGRGEIIKNVPRNMFYPVPNVDSAVVKISLVQKALNVDAEMYKKVVHTAFSSRRKTLENNLINNFSLTREQAEHILTECGISLKARGETLSPQQFALLTDKIKEII